VLLLFGLGLEFSWSKIREVGLAVLIIGVVEISTMISLGYGLGRLLGWSPMDALFLGAALHISSSAIIVKILRDLGKLKLLSSRLIVGILVVEDFAAVVIITLLSGAATTGTADFGDIGSLVLRLVVFVVASLVLGAMIVPRLISFTHKFQSREALLITGLGLCFTMALLGEYLGLSVAAGAFLMGALIGDTEHAEEIVEVVTPIRDMFAALFFVAIGMLINVTQFRDFIVPGIIVAGVFIMGKILSNTLAAFISGHPGRTALQVGMGMPQMGEFSLAIAKVGFDRGTVIAPLYPVIAFATALTSLTTPYITRSADSIADFFEHRSPMLLKAYVSRLADWLQALRATFARDSEAALRVQHSIKVIVINLLIIVIIISIGTIVLNFVEDRGIFSRFRTDYVGLGIGFVSLILCLPSFVIIWRNLGTLVDEAVIYVLNRRRSAKKWRRETLRIVLRDSILIALSIFVAIWFVPFFASLLSIGSFALAIPLLLLAVILFFVLHSVWDIHRQLERHFSRVLLGEEHTSTSESATLLGVSESRVADVARRMRLTAIKKGRNRHTDKSKGKELTEDYTSKGEEPTDSVEETD
jgi:CPA2 family monovalent cation:H+ antiporter-2